ncbi:MAG: hypothetical protein EBR82_32140 [Caulobacteraceae bacterium]|nr:hypothetical protein [Caulobacteraceae bacterium]
MQTTVKHSNNNVVVYIAFGERAVELGLFPVRFATHSKRTQFARKPKVTAPTDEPSMLDKLPGFTEPEHLIQTNMAFV